MTNFEKVRQGKNNVTLEFKDKIKATLDRRTEKQKTRDALIE